MPEKQFAVIGDPIAHSLSPIIHNALYARHGLDCAYTAVHVRRDALDAFFHGRARELAGFNVTMPLKEAVLAYMDETDPEARAAGSVNTVVMGEQICGYSTDADGLRRAIAARGRSYAGQRVLLLGAGGAAGAIARSICADGGSVCIAGRTLSRAQTLAVSLSSGQAVSMSQLAECAPDCSIFINATPLGMEGCAGDFSDLSFLQSLPACALVTDLIYRPAQTRLLRAASDAGLETMNGLDMLIYQAFAAFELWFGFAPDRADYEAVLAALPI